MKKIQYCKIKLYFMYMWVDGIEFLYAHEKIALVYMYILYSYLSDYLYNIL